MALIPHSGSLSQTSSQNNHKININELVVPDTIIRLPDDRVVAQLTPMDNTFNHKTSTNPERFHELLGSLLGFADGSPIKVTYYNSYQEDMNERSYTVDRDTTRNNVHTDFIKILDFEIRLTAPMATQFNSEQNFTEMTGEALCYSNFEPFQGDLFLYKINDRLIGEFRVTNTEPLSIHHAAQYKINFDLVSYLNDERFKEIEACVTQTRYFDKQKFLHSEGVLLTHESYNQLHELERLKNDIIKYHFKTFFDEAMSTLMRPDNIFDPYVVKYLLSKITINQVKQRPLLLKTNLPEYEDSIWYMISDPSSINDFTKLKTKCYTYLIKMDMYRTDLNPLVNKLCIVIGEMPLNNNLVCNHCGQMEYAFSSHFYNKDRLSSITDVLIYEAIIDNKYNVDKIIEIIKSYRSLEPINQFYYIPLYIHLIEQSLKRI